MYETCIRILHVTPGKAEGKTSLDETDSWIQKGSKTTCRMHGKMDSETDSKTLDETNGKQNEKTTFNQLCPRKPMDHNISSPKSFTSPKVKPCLHCHHRPQSGWGW
jgi:hypothetical protein